MATKAGTHDVAGDRNCCASCSASAAVPEHAGVNLPGIATVVRYRDLPALDCHGDKLGVGLHLGPTGWMEWHTPEHGGRQTVVPAGSLSLVPARANIRWQRDQPSEFLLVALQPTFVADAAGYGEEITWNLVPVFQDPVIAHMLSALRAEVCDGCPSGRPYEHFTGDYDLNPVILGLPPRILVKPDLVCEHISRPTCISSHTRRAGPSCRSKPSAFPREALRTGSEHTNGLSSSSTRSAKPTSRRARAASSAAGGAADCRSVHLPSSSASA